MGGAARARYERGWDRKRLRDGIVTQTDQALVVGFDPG